MPFRYQESTTPRGSPLLEIHATGHISLADAEEMGAMIAPGGANHRWRLLTYAEKGVEYAPAARKYFPSMNSNYFALATLVTSPIVRAAINIMMRLTGQVPDVKMFSDAAEALAWLDTYERKD
jgi:hypothetical protein